MQFLKNLTLGVYVPKDSLVHRTDPRIKLLIIFIFMTSIFYFKSTLSFIALFIILLACIGISGISLGYVLSGIKSILFLLVLAFVFNLAFTPGEAWITVGSYSLSREGLSTAVLITVRLVFLMLATSLLTLTTSYMQLTDAIEKLLKPFRRIGVPGHEIAMMMAIALRFIPTLAQESEKIMKAQLSRGANFEQGNLWQRARHLLPLLVPLFAHAFKSAEDLATAMESRCYQGGDGRTRLRELHLSLRDWMVLAVFGAVFSALCYGELIWRQHC